MNEQDAGGSKRPASNDTRNDAPNSAGTIRVVIADDHAVARSGVRRLLEAAGGFTVVGEASTGEEALDLVRSEEPDVLVLDLEMPEGSGPEVARRLEKEGTSATRVLALSAHESKSYVEKLLQSGASGYLTKDQAPERIAEAARAVAGGAERWFVRPSALGEGAGPLEELTNRERDVLQLMAEGRSNEDISEQLYIAEDTVRTHLSSVYRKIGAHSAREAVAWAWQNGLAGKEE